jgi:predicted RNA binding protein YcfA (HicA-like mRNA interferase family)
MAILPALSGREVVKIFEADGWRIARQRGSHIILVKDGHIATLSVPDHRDVAKGTLRSLILRPHRAAKSRSPSSPMLKSSASAAPRGWQALKYRSRETYTPADARRQRLAAGRVLGKIVLRIAHRVLVDTRTERRSQKASPGSSTLF